MASEAVDFLRPTDFQRETPLGRELVLNCVANPNSDVYGLSLPKYTTASNLYAYGYVTTFRIPLNLTMGTGLTFKVYLTDDGQNSLDLGKVVKVGITLLDCTQGPSNFDLDVAETELATEVTASATLASTTGVASITSIAIANAALPASAAVGDLIAMRIRRLGSNASDTLLNQAILMCVAVQNT